MRKTKKTITPVQSIGHKTGASAMKKMKNPVEAKNKFLEAKRRLLDINNWDKYTGTTATKFSLMDRDGEPANRKPQKGDYIRIDIPGPGPVSGQGYDWVCIEEFEERDDRISDIDFFAFRVRPANNPTTIHESAPSHFYSEKTTSTFIIHREGTQITAAEKGRNEIPNAHTDHTVDNIRNSIVATGAALGFSIPQWKMLMEGLLE